MIKKSFYIKRIFIFVIICIITYDLFSQVINRNFERITIKDGLSNSGVIYIFQDSKGFMWFATYGGLNKYDGYSFKVYKNNENNETNLTIKEIINLCEDNYGNIWITPLIKSGIFIFDPYTESFTNYINDPLDSTSLSCDEVISTYKDRSGSMWICTRNALNKVIFSDSKRPKVLGFKKYYYNNINIEYVSIIFENKNGEIILFADYLYHFNKQDGSFSKGTSLSTDNSVFSTFEDKNSNIWLGTRFGIVKLKFDKNIGTYIKEDIEALKNLPKNRTFAIQDFKDRIWIATESKGLFLYDYQQNYLVNYENSKTNFKSISDNTIYSLCLDNSGILWVGTFSQGLCKCDLNKKQFKHFESIAGNKNSLSGNVISSIHSISKDETWVGVDLEGGINRLVFNGNSDPLITTYKNGKANSVLSLVQRRNGDIWAGNAGGYITILTPEKFGSGQKAVIKMFEHKGWPFSIFEDSDEQIWVGTYGDGLTKYNPKDMSMVNYKNNLQKPTSLVDNIVWSIFEDQYKNIWIGGREEGISVITKEARKKTNFEFINFKNNRLDTNSLSNNQVNVFFVDHTGDMWIGTGGGLNKVILNQKIINNTIPWQNITFKAYHEKDGLPNEQINGITEDNSGNLWLSTYYGLSKFNVKDQTFTNYDEADGLQSNEFWHNAFFKDLNGRMYFGGQNGLNIFYPDSIKPNLFLPKVVFTDFKLFNKSVKINEKINNQIILDKSINHIDLITLNYKNNVFTLEFASLQYSNPKKNKYAYIMEGFDKNWVQTASDRRFATYTNLPPGTYVFKVKACNLDGIWNDNYSSLNFNILPPWWATWWFRIICILFIVSSALGFYVYKISSIKKQKQILEQKVEDRTIQLREVNTELEEKQEEILQQKEEILASRDELEIKNSELESQKEEIISTNEELKQKNDELDIAYSNIKILSEFGQKITSVLDLEAISKMVYEYLKSLIDVFSFGIGIYNETSQTIDFLNFIDNGKILPTFRKSLANETSLAVKCFKNKEEIVINKISDNYKEYLEQLPELQFSGLPTSMILLPLIFEDNATGVISINSYKENAYNQNDITNVRSLSSYISIALENAKAYKIINLKNEAISGSIRYGKTIQQAFLPTKTIIDEFLENCILFKPKDIVSGDFYWFSVINNLQTQYSDYQTLFIAVVDCTGHGVPGAFMSLIGISLLKEIIHDKKIHDPAKILEELDNNIVESLNQIKTDNNDGMDVCLVKIEKRGIKTPLLTFSGAKRPLICINRITGESNIISGTRKSIGGLRFLEKKINFENNIFEINDNLLFFLTTDGYIDQCNPSRKKLGTERLINKLLEIKDLPLENHKDELDKLFENHRDSSPQRDDVTIVGIRLKT